jgi:drug/metabolite transporter superfamily protein YnfA
VLCLAYSIWVFERESHTQDLGLPDSLWLLLVTMTTVGYGDVTPENHFGRMFAVIGAVTGVLGTAFLVAFVSERLRLTKAEEKVVSLMSKDRLRRVLKECAARAIQASWRCWAAHNAGGTSQDSSNMAVGRSVCNPPFCFFFCFCFEREKEGERI